MQDISTLSVVIRMQSSAFEKIAPCCSLRRTNSLCTLFWLCRVVGSFALNSGVFFVCQTSAWLLVLQQGKCRCLSLCSVLDFLTLHLQCNRWLRTETNVFLTSHDLASLCCCSLLEQLEKLVGRCNCCLVQTFWTGSCTDHQKNSTLKTLFSGCFCSCARQQRLRRKLVYILSDHDCNARSETLGNTVFLLCPEENRGMAMFASRWVMNYSEEQELKMVCQECSMVTLCGEGNKHGHD